MTIVDDVIEIQVLGWGVLKHKALVKTASVLVCVCLCICVCLCYYNYGYVNFGADAKLFAAQMVWCAACVCSVCWIAAGKREEEEEEADKAGKHTFLRPKQNTFTLHVALYTRNNSSSKSQNVRRTTRTDCVKTAWCTNCATAQPCRALLESLATTSASNLACSLAPIR